jgi:hypothetical protein
MIKASSLYVAIIIALVIAVLSGSLIATAYYYRWSLQKNQRQQRLMLNLESGCNLLLSKYFETQEELMSLDLFDTRQDSIFIRKKDWGIFDLAEVYAFEQLDTLKKSFLIAKDIQDDRAVLYLSDEDRPLSISGTSRISGDAYLPKSGIRQAYVDGKGYTGKQLVYGKIKESGRDLPAFNEVKLTWLKEQLKDTVDYELISGDSLINSFFKSTIKLRLKKNLMLDYYLKGNIIIYADSVLKISVNAFLEDVLVFAPAIIIEKGFKGSGQFFATDSIKLEEDVHLDYPSCLGVIKNETASHQPKISLANNIHFRGVIFTEEKERSTLQTMVSMAKNNFVEGEIFVKGMLKLEKPQTIKGKVSCNRFIIQTPSTLYENYLIDISLDRNTLNSYYLSTNLWVQNKDLPNKVLKWLN